MADYLGPVHTEANAVPPITDTPLADALDDITGLHAALDQIADGYLHLATTRLTAQQTQTVLYTLAGNEGGDVLTALAGVITRLTNPDTNPCLRTLPLEQQKDIQRYGENHAYETAEYAPRQDVAEAIALIDEA